MSAPEGLDPRIGAYLGESPGDLPLAAHLAIARATQGLAQRPAPVRWPWRHRGSRPIGTVGFVAALLAVVALIAGLLGAGSLVDRTIVPVASPSLPVVVPPTDAPTRAPTPTPAETPALTPSASPSGPPAIDATYTSARYAYSIGHPSTWTVTPAIGSWPGDGTWTRQPYADVIAPDVRTRLAVVAMDVPPAMTVDEAVARYLPARRDVPSRGIRSCPGTAPAGGAWRPAEIGGHPGNVREYCAYVEGVLAVGRRIYVVTLVSHSRGVSQRSAFDAIVRTLAVRPDTPLGGD